MGLDLAQRRGERDIELVIRQLRGGLSVGQLFRSTRQRRQPLRPAQEYARRWPPPHHRAAGPAADSCLLSSGGGGW